MEGCRSGESADCVAVGAARADRRRLGRSPKAGLALLDQDLARNSRELIGFPNPLLYYLGDSSDRASVFGDVTAYSNDTEPCFGCPAAEGSADFADVPVRATAGQGRSARSRSTVEPEREPRQVILRRIGSILRCPVDAVGALVSPRPPVFVGYVCLGLRLAPDVAQLFEQREVSRRRPGCSFALPSARS